MSHQLTPRITVRPALDCQDAPCSSGRRPFLQRHARADDVLGGDAPDGPVAMFRCAGEG